MELKVKEHVNFLKSLLDKEDSFEFLQMAHLKTSAIYWSLTAAILLDALDEIYPQNKRRAILDFIEKCYKEDGGFAGNEGAHDSHLLFTLSAVQIMIILHGKGNYPSWFNVDRTVKYVIGLQDNNTGAFKGDLFGEIDTRFTYCAVATLSLLNKMESLDEAAKELAVKFLESCRNFDGGFGAVPGSESHGGNIFCCISALKILGVNNQNANDNLLEWLVWRQLPCGGFNGRPEKLPDVCYSWWILSVLKSLNRIDHINKSKLSEFILKCQDIHEGMGGFADRPEDVGDIFHTLFGLTGLSILQHPKVTVMIDPLYCLPCHLL